MKLDIDIFLWILAHVKIIALSTKVCPRFSKKKRFNFICVYNVRHFRCLVEVLVNLYNSYGHF